MQIRSFRVVFDLERRIHRIDRFRLPLPYGLPLRSVAYFFAALACGLMAGGLPGVGALAGSVPAPVRFVVVPAVVAYVLTQLRVDGRVAHQAAGSWFAWRVGPRRVAAFQAARGEQSVRLDDVTMAPDERGSRYRRAQLVGPGEALLRCAFAARQRGRTLHVTSTGHQSMALGKRVMLEEGQRVTLR